MKRSILVRALFCLAVCTMMLTMMPLFIPSVSAAAKITDTVNLSRPEKNMSGSGYYWNNREDTLTLDGLYIDTDKEFGLRIPDDATVILKGKNIIRASRAALTVPGNVTFKGDGSLILTSEDMGIYFYATDATTVARFLEGTYEINAVNAGIWSSDTSISLVNGRYDINISAMDGHAILGRELKLYGGKMTMNNAVHATVSLEVRATELDITAPRAALSSDKTLRLEEVSLKVGADAASLSKADSYSGENCLKTQSTANTLGSSLLFGDSVPMFVDILVVLALLALIAAGIAGPFLRSYKKRKEAQAALEAILNDTKPSKRA